MLDELLLPEAWLNGLPYPGKAALIELSVAKNMAMSGRTK
jgi:hypothetical protein